MMLAGGIEHTADAALHMAAAAACGFAMIWIARRGDTARPDRPAIMSALAVTAVWAIAHAAFGPLALGTQTGEIARNLAWIFATYRLFANDGRDRNLAPIRPVVIALAFLEMLQIPLILVAFRFGDLPEIAALTGQITLLFRILLAVGAVVLLHNLYAGAGRAGREALRWSVLSLAGVWVYELNYHTVAYLGGAPSAGLGLMRPALFVAVAMLLAAGSRPATGSRRFKPSRAVTFQFLSLIVIGAYLLVMVAVAQSIDMLGGGGGSGGGSGGENGAARLSQVGFVILASAFAMWWLPSKRLRGWLRVTAVKHLFQHRYDYRAEWLRFTDTIGRADGSAPPLQERAVQAMADIADSPSGLLLTPDETGGLTLAARWNWPGIAVPARAAQAGLAAMMERQDYILDLDDMRGGRGPHAGTMPLPDWLTGDPRAWAMIPLLHFGQLVGVVVLARPADRRRLDWEDFDLLQDRRAAACKLPRRTGRADRADGSGTVRRFQPPHRFRHARHQEFGEPDRPAVRQCGKARRQSRLPRRHADYLAKQRGKTDRAAGPSGPLWREWRGGGARDRSVLTSCAASLRDMTASIRSSSAIAIRVQSRPTPPRWNRRWRI